MENFRIFSDNSGLNANQINSFIQEISSVGEFCETTIKFCGIHLNKIDLVAKNKRFMYINEISKKYIKLYLLLTKEEKITILSAHPLSNDQKNDVRNALMANKENEGKTFIIDFEVNPSLIGGLQMYTENKFMDLSLSSRIDRVKEEINKLI
jgi:F-type H+-transporting ATPase subunit O